MPARPWLERVLVGILSCCGLLLVCADAHALVLHERLDFDHSQIRIRELDGKLHVAHGRLPQVESEDSPILPVSVRTFYVPEGFEVDRVDVAARGEISLAEGVRPSLRRAPVADDPESVIRAIPRAALREGSDRVPAVSGASAVSGFLAGHRLHSVTVYPVRWDRTGERLLLATSLDVEVHLRPARVAGGLVPDRRSAAAERAHAEVLKALVANPEDVALPTERASGEGGFLPTDVPSVEGSAVDQVIVTTAAFESAFQPLADWKTKKGVPTVIRTVEWIDTTYPLGHDRPERIRMFLQDAYSKWGCYLVLVGGDFQEVTPRLAYNRFFFGGSEIPTDQYWVCLDGDWNGDKDDKYGEGMFMMDPGDGADLYPDLFIGRAPVETIAEVNTFVAKSMMYDKSPPVGYVEDHCSFGEVLFPADWVFGNPLEEITLDGKDLILDLDAFVDPSWTRTHCFQVDDLLDRTHALARLEEGHHLLTLMTHGDAFKFSVGNGENPLIYTADVEALTNGDELPIVVATACNPNQFDLESCGEAFLNNPLGGALAVIGPTRVDFPLSAVEFHKEMYSLIFDHGVTRLGAATQVSRIPFVAISQSDATPDRWTLQSKLLLGDPELRIWMEEPKTLGVSHAASVPLGTDSFVVTVTDDLAAPLPDALVCVSDGAGTYSRARTDASGLATLLLGAIDPGTVDVVVTAADFLPDEGTLTIDPVAGPNLALESHTIDDDDTGASSGNGDGVVDAGETIEIGVSIRNGGGAAADTSTVTASIDPGSSATFDLLWNGLQDASKVFVGPDRTNPVSVPFTLDFVNPSIPFTGTPTHLFAADTTAGHEGIFVWQDREGWHLWWSDGVDSVDVSGTITTDGRVRTVAGLGLESTDSWAISSGEDSLTFAGTTHTMDLWDQLDLALSDSTIVSINSGSADLGDLAASTSGLGTVVVDVAAGAEPERIAYVDLALTSTSGGPWSGVVPLVFAGPDLEAWILTLDDSVNPPVNGNGNGLAEVGETVRVTMTVVNRGTGEAGGVNGLATATTGITFLDDADAYGDIARLAHSSGTDGYVFTIDDSSGTSVDLLLTDDLGRTSGKTIEFVPPTAPLGLDFTSTPTEITLKWAPNQQPDLAGYNVYRSPTSMSGFTLQNFELLRTGARYVDEQLTLGSGFYYHVTAVDSSGNESLPSAELFAWTTQVQVEGWPQFAGSNVFGSLTMADLDGAGASELYVPSQDFSLYGFAADGDSLAGFPIETGANIWSTPGVGDVDEDGDGEIFWGSFNSWLYGVHHDGSPYLGGSEQIFDAIGSLRSGVTVADVDADSDLEILFGTDNGYVYALNHDLTGMVDSTGVLFQATGPTPRVWGPVAVADLDGDPQREIAFATFADSLYVVNHDGTLVPGFPRAALDGFQTGPAIGDLDNDGDLEILIGNNDDNLYAFNHDGSDYVSGGILATLPDDIRGVPALANLDLDPELEILIGCMDGRLYGFEHDGSGILQPGGLFADIDSTTGISASPIVVDVDGDSDFEIFIGHRNGSFYGFHHDGSGVVGLPIPTFDGIYATAAAGDLDHDGDVEVAFASYDQTVNVLDFSGPSTPAAYEWATFAGNNFRTSSYGEQLPYITDVPAGAPVAIAFALAQNSPNPFVGATEIRYALPRTGPVTLKVFNVSGRLVRTLVNGPVTAGRHTVVWDGRDDRGRALSSGVYFYRLRGPESSLTRKSLRLR